MSIIGAINAFLHPLSAYLLALIVAHPYPALVILMSLEGAALPIPSEVVIPAAGFLAARGTLSLPFAFIALLFGNLVGQAIDYSLGYYIGKEIIYKNLQKLRIKRRDLKAFDAWFLRNDVAAVFISRMLPEIRSIMSFPAGFVKMSPPKFFLWSMAGSAIFDFVLILFGYYALGGTTGYILVTLIGLFLLGLYIAYRYGTGRIRGTGKKK